MFCNACGGTWSTYVCTLYIPDVLLYLLVSTLHVAFCIARPRGLHSPTSLSLHGSTVLEHTGAQTGVLELSTRFSSGAEEHYYHEMCVFLESRGSKDQSQSLRAQPPAPNDSKEAHRLAVCSSLWPGTVENLCVAVRSNTKEADDTASGLVSFSLEIPRN